MIRFSALLLRVGAPLAALLALGIVFARLWPRPENVLAVPPSQPGIMAKAEVSLFDGPAPNPPAAPARSYWDVFKPPEARDVTASVVETPRTDELPEEARQ